MGRDRFPGTDQKKWTVILFGGMLLATKFTFGAMEKTCNCSTDISFQKFRTKLAPEICCLNFTRTKIDTLDWSIFAGTVGLKELHLSNCDISHIKNVSVGSFSLEILYLDHNKLNWLPDNFLKHAPSLRVIHLENNQLQNLSESFLETSNHIQEIYLDFNNLSSLPSGIFKPSLLTLGLSHNSWDCTCNFLEHLGKYILSSFDIVCHTPEHYYGINIKNISKAELCQTHRLTALFICLPLVAVLVLVTCYFCKHKKKTKRKTGYALHDRKECQLATVEKNGTNRSDDHQCSIPPIMDVNCAAGSENNLLRNQILLKPSTALLESSRDLYEEVEIKLGASDDSLTCRNLDQEKLGTTKPVTEEEETIDGEPEAETLSVTDVLRDSADRERLYMNKSVDYYNLVPGIELEDSDHMENENVNLC
ncbi:SLIT and NTRK-like protein 6 isoform X1 [Pantherophis guttatus]|uniref:SLIT and NTRK-like protein 6 isoform X1 n=2 Tax=Pantherophis guttatus TaxID=94885 RepID=A0A6P9BLC8_PANGU|nr:SLIT and NTRK-like protein 6 isoform X1 [Pantherophis guttatus]